MNTKGGLLYWQASFWRFMRYKFCSLKPKMLLFHI